LLNNSDFKAQALKGGGFDLVGKVDSVFDLKTGGATLDDKWVKEVAQRLQLNSQAIMEVKAGGALKSTMTTNMKMVASMQGRLPKGTKYLGWGGKVLTAGMIGAAYNANANTYGDQHALKYTIEETVNPLGFHSGHMVDKTNDFFQNFWGFLEGRDPAEIDQPHKY
jgi:hypothetical protein